MAHQPSEFKAVNGARVAVCITGEGSPLLLLNRFRGTMNNWDPALLEALARERRVVTFDGLGNGEVSSAKRIHGYVWLGSQVL